MRPIVTNGVALSVCRSVGLSVKILSPAKTAKPIEMSFDSCGPNEPCIRWESVPLRWGNFDGVNVICTASGWLKEQDQ